MPVGGLSSGPVFLLMAPRLILFISKVIFDRDSNQCLSLFSVYVYAQPGSLSSPNIKIHPPPLPLSTPAPGPAPQFKHVVDLRGCFRLIVVTVQSSFTFLGVSFSLQLRGVWLSFYRCRFSALARSALPHSARYCCSSICLISSFFHPPPPLTLASPPLAACRAG